MRVAVVTAVLLLGVAAARRLAGLYRAHVRDLHRFAWYLAGVLWGVYFSRSRRLRTSGL